MDKNNKRGEKTEIINITLDECRFFINRGYKNKNLELLFCNECLSLDLKTSITAFSCAAYRENSNIYVIFSFNRGAAYESFLIKNTNYNYNVYETHSFLFSKNFKQKYDKYMRELIQKELNEALEKIKKI